MNERTNAALFLRNVARNVCCESDTFKGTLQIMQFRAAIRRAEIFPTGNISSPVDRTDGKRVLRKDNA